MLSDGVPSVRLAVLPPDEGRGDGCAPALRVSPARGRDHYILRFWFSRAAKSCGFSKLEPRR